MSEELIKNSLKEKNNKLQGVEAEDFEEDFEEPLQDEQLNQQSIPQEFCELSYNGFSFKIGSNNLRADALTDITYAVFLKITENKSKRGTNYTS